MFNPKKVIDKILGKEKRKVKQKENLNYKERHALDMYNDGFGKSDILIYLYDKVEDRDDALKIYNDIESGEIR